MIHDDASAARVAAFVKLMGAMLSDGEAPAPGELAGLTAAERERGELLYFEGRAAEAPIREQRLRVLSFLARVRPGIPVSEGLASLSEDEAGELDRLLEEDES